MPEDEVLVWKVPAVDRLSTCPVTSCEVCERRVGDGARQPRDWLLSRGQKPLAAGCFQRVLAARPQQLSRRAAWQGSEHSPPPCAMKSGMIRCRNEPL